MQKIRDEKKESRQDQQVDKKERKTEEVCQTTKGEKKKEKTNISIDIIHSKHFLSVDFF